MAHRAPNHPHITVAVNFPQDPTPTVSPTTRITEECIHGCHETEHARNTNQQQTGNLQLTGADPRVHAGANADAGMNVGPADGAGHDGEMDVDD
ncbi:hypothetical protein BGZ95_002409 [Linnemannia exigua]|uniref:Uncharacterized protein n=1 Tax=Linnemannia exigua TaxID=604196 RepID=A0AAD4DIH5_9FUNG|nr:hypothetical protein BGZ95_002409 [Linnemannia exigua]